ncbi:hypothetical protein BH20ACI3_BH20ACI3_32070 [soil metagenome]
MAGLRIPFALLEEFWNILSTLLNSRANGSEQLPSAMTINPALKIPRANVARASKRSRWFADVTPVAHCWACDVAVRAAAERLLRFG